MDPLRNTSKVHLASEDEKVQSLETSGDYQDSASSASKRVCFTPHDSASLTAEDKKKQRAERFKIV
jgi:CRISPR/Cas system-associated protein Cas7 (RAMP superfamily)